MKLGRASRQWWIAQLGFVQHWPMLLADLLIFLWLTLQQVGFTRNNMRFSSHVLGMRYAFVPQNNCPLFFMWNFPLGGIYASDFLCGISHVISRAQSVWNVGLISKHSGQCDRHWFILIYAWAMGILSFWKTQFRIFATNLNRSTVAFEIVCRILKPYFGVFFGFFFVKKTVRWYLVGKFVCVLTDDIFSFKLSFCLGNGHLYMV